ncbi:phosphatidate cytidylyltransferase [Pseudokineococcus lusitanus]|uniref:Phosphatidate cytidylyltransferase n=1 Tax=Pseudokineococcus lusitanus TaxID=763993 RepID=A0A3N1HMQ7_9ACTN|nr:phosphatidate cytidylyltransferase [Pseudokineococcus lusitanus]ROP43729.1 phosphatidate cytidylyltransferase [Pseudokineococcus lusitanus]
MAPDEPAPDAPPTGGAPSAVPGRHAAPTTAVHPSPGVTPVPHVVPGPTPPAAPRRRSAGRDLPAAIGVGVGLGVLALGSLLVVKDVFLALVVVAVAVGCLEVSAALAGRGLRAPRVPVVVGGSLLVVGAYVVGPEAAVVVHGLTVLVVVGWRVAEGRDGAVRDVAAGVLVLSWLPLLAAFAALMLAEPDGEMRVLVFLAAVVASDVGGYAAGVVWGRHPLAPSVSPKKSWEGLAGSVGLSIVVGAALVAVLLDGPWWAGAVLGALVGLTATFGDLAESMLKRDLGIKDMGTTLPGHGGVMDRLDSLLVTAPAAWLVLQLLVPA